MGMLLCSCLLAQKLPTNDTLTGGLDEVLVSVNKWEQKQNEIPNTIVRIDMRDAQLHNPQTAADLLTLSGHVFIQKSQMGGGSPMIRGFATNRILIVVDGVRMNNAIFRSGNLQNVINIDPLSVQNAEVIFGPGSIIYGSDAIGGVMDFHTFTPVFSKGKKPLLKLNSFTRFSSANKERTTHLDLNIASQKLSFLASATYSNFNDLRMGKNGGDDSYLKLFYVERVNGLDTVLPNPDPYVQRPTGYHQWNALAKLRYKASAQLDLQYAYHYSATGNIPRYDRLVEMNNQLPSFAEWFYGPQVWTMHQLQAHYNRSNRLFNSARFILSIQNYEESRNDRRFRSNQMRTQTESVAIVTANLDLNKTLAEKHELFYGVEYVANNVGSVASTRNIVSGTVVPAATRYPNNSTWNTAGVYASYKYNINRQLTFTTGARYNHVFLHAPFDTSFFKFPYSEASLQQGAVTGSAGLVFRPSDHWQWNTNLSTGFRVPNIDDIGKVFDSEAGNVIVPNPALRSEYAYNLDVGVAYHQPKKFRFDVTLFYTILNDAIVRRPFTFNGKDSIMYEGVRSRVQALQNVAQATVWGVQAGFQYDFAKNLSWIVRGNYIDGRETDDNNNRQVRLRHAPPFYGNSSIRYASGDIALEVNGQFNGEISAANLAPSEQSKPFIYAQDVMGRPYSPGWYTINYKSTYKATKHVQVSFGIENVTNRRYRPYASGIVAAGRNFIFSLKAGL